MASLSDKEINTYSKKGRIKTGAKGIGRFALEKLSQTTTVYSKHDNNKLVYWNLKFCCRLPLSLQNFSDNMQHILIIMSGGLGDFCFTAKYIEALHRYLGNNTIFDIQVPKEDFYFLSSYHSLFSRWKKMSQ